MLVRRWHCFEKAGAELRRLAQTKIKRRRKPIGGKGGKPAVLRPGSEDARIFQKFDQENLVITFEAHGPARLPALDQEIKDARWVRPAVDVIAHENLDRLGNRMLLKIFVDAQQKAFEQIRPAMDIADRIN